MELEAMLEEVQQHLSHVLEAPDTQLDGRLLEHVDRQVSEALNHKQRTTLLNLLSELLPSLQQDPSPVTQLIERLLASDKASFSDVLAIQPKPNFTLGLAAPSWPINLVTLSLLEKAKSRLADINHVAGEQEIVGQLLILWLCTEETAVAHKASQVITGLVLGPGAPPSDHVDPLTEPNLMWRRLFRDKDIYGTIFSLCSLSTAGQEGQPSKRQKTVAQGRLLDMLLAIRADPVRTSQIPETEQRYGVKEGGLLEFAILHMIDHEDDDLMLSTLINFCINFIKTDSEDGTDMSTPALDFLKRHGLHTSCMAHYLQPSPTHTSWVVGDAARYVGTYCSSHREDFLQNPQLPFEILDLLHDHLSSISTGSWLSGRFPENDLMVLSLLPQQLLASQSSKPLLPLIHPATSHVQVLNTLTSIFSPPTTRHSSDRAAARALYFLYLEAHPQFWDLVTKAADTVALLEPALAANHLIACIIDTSWHPLPSSPSPSPQERYPLPTETWLRQTCNHGAALPESGIEAILSARTAQTVLPYLMKPAQTFSNAVGGGKGDVESAAWKVAVAKQKALLRFRDKILLMGGSPEVESMVVAVNRRLALGPMGGASDVGGQIGTMEM